MPVPEPSIILEAIIAGPDTSWNIAVPLFVKKLPTIFASIQPSSHQKPIGLAFVILLGSLSSTPDSDRSMILLRNVKSFVCVTFISDIVQNAPHFFTLNPAALLPENVLPIYVALCVLLAPAPFAPLSKNFVFFTTRLSASPVCSPIAELCAKIES